MTEHELNPDFDRIVDVAARLAAFKDFPHQETLQIERRRGGDDAIIVAAVAARLGMPSATILHADVMRFIDENGILNDTFWNGRQHDVLAWYKLHMGGEPPVLIHDVVANAQGRDARRRLERWIDEDGQTMLVLLVDEIDDKAWPTIRNDKKE